MYIRQINCLSKLKDFHSGQPPTDLQRHIEYDSLYNCVLTKALSGGNRSKIYYALSWKTVDQEQQTMFLMCQISQSVLSKSSCLLEKGLCFDGKDDNAADLTFTPQDGQNSILDLYLFNAFENTYTLR